MSAASAATYNTEPRFQPRTHQIPAGDRSTWSNRREQPLVLGPGYMNNQWLFMAGGN